MWQPFVQEMTREPPPPARAPACGATACTDRAQSSLTVISKVAISGLSSGILVVSGTVNLQFLSFCALITEEGFLISPCYSLELCIQMGISFLFSLPFISLLFTAICKASSDSYFAFLHFFFLEMVLIPISHTVSRTSVRSSSGTLSDLVPSFHFSLPLYSHKGSDLGHS